MGFRGGFGLEQMLTRCLALNLSWVCTSYWTQEATAVGDLQSLAINVNGHRARFRSRARKQTTSIGLSYYF